MGINEFIQIGNQIKKLRTEKGYTQKEMSVKTGIPYSTYSNYENNNREPNAAQLKKIAAALNISIQELLSYDNMIGNITPSGDIVYVDSDVLEYNRIIDKQENGEGFTPYDRHFISNYIDKSPLDRNWFIENGLKSKEKNLSSIQQSYEHLNKEGQEEAAKRIKELTEIERYTKPDEWFKGRMTKEEIDEAVEKYLNDDTPPESPQD